MRVENILFINPPSPDRYVYIRDINRSGRRSMERTIWPQTSLAMLAAVFPDDNVKIIDCIAEEIGYKQLYQIMEDFKPTWVVFNPISSTVSHDMIVAHYGKTLGAKTVAISPHTKVYKEECYERFPALDHAVDYKKGGVEPEYNLRELIKGIPGNGTRFEDIPPARQDLLPLSRYSLPFIGRGYTFVVTSRGCPWSCIYCRQNVMNENRVRFRPVDTVLEEIRRYRLKNISFHADTATMNKKWMYEFCNRIGEVGFPVRWICNSRVDTVDYSMLKAMKKAGCWMIVFGCESGDNRVLAMNKKEATVEQAEIAIRDSKRAGLQVWAYFMLGMYGDDKKSMERTIQFACSQSPDIVNFAIAAPYPGTEWGEIATRNNWLTDSRWESFDQNYSSQVAQPDCPVSLVHAFHRRAYLKWYLSWRGVKFLARGFKPRYFTFFVRTAMDHLKL